MPQAVGAGSDGSSRVLPVTPRQIWMAVVITTAISYLGYVLQTYLFPRKGLLLTGLIGGVYSSTVAVLVLAKKSKANPAIGRRGRGRHPAGGLDDVPAAARPGRDLPRSLGAPRRAGAARAGAAWPPATRSGCAGARRPADEPLRQEPRERRRGRGRPDRSAQEPPGAQLRPLLRRHVRGRLPGHQVRRSNFQDLGLRMLSFVVGFSDITPFVVSVLQGNLGIGDAQILQAIIIASASNNLLKTAYTYMFGSRRTANLAAPGMLGLAIPAIVYALFGL